MAKKPAKILLYPVVIEPCEEGGYFASCPSLQGCHAEGATYSQVIARIENVIRTHLELRRKHGEILPAVTVNDRQNISVSLPILVAG